MGGCNPRVGVTVASIWLARLCRLLVAGRCSAALLPSCHLAVIFPCRYTAACPSHLPLLEGRSALSGRNTWKAMNSSFPRDRERGTARSGMLLGGREHEIDVVELAPLATCMREGELSLSVPGLHVPSPPPPPCLSQISVGDIASDPPRQREKRAHQMIQYPGRYGRKPGVLGTNGTKRMESRLAPGALSAMDGTLAACSSPSSTDH